MRVRGLLCLVVLAGCSGPVRLSSSEGRLALSAERASFPLTFVGHPTEIAVPLSNRSNAKLPFRASSAPPFSVVESGDELAGGDRVDLRIRFDPRESGRHVGELVVRTEEGELRLPLEGDARAAPACESADPCRSSHFDPATGACVATARPEGASCETSCVTSGQCRFGSCVGEARRCDDGNACTDDACAPGEGCVHGATACAAPADPCQAAFCDPVQGCGAREVEDGTSCGPSNCTTAHVCVAGACVARAVPEGSTCGSASPCQGQGHCESATCVRPSSAGALVEAWRFDPPAGDAIAFPGLVDDRGNHYFAVCGHSQPRCDPQTDGPCSPSCRLVSLGAQGGLRFQVPLTTGHLWELRREGAMVLAPDRLFVTTAESGADWLVEAFSLVDGALLWRRSLTSELVVAEKNERWGRPSASTKGARVLPTGDVLVSAEGYAGDGCIHAPLGQFTLLLAGSDGHTRWRRHHDGWFSDPVLDEGGRAYFSGSLRADSGVMEPHLLALAPDGTEALRAPVTAYWNPILAAHGGRLYDSQNGVRSSADGGELVRFAMGRPGAYGASSPVLANQRGFALGTREPCLEDPCYAEGATTELYGLDLATGAVTFTRPLEGDRPDVTQPILTAANEALFVTAPQGAQARLLSVSASGADSFSCAVPQSKRIHGTSTLSGGRFVIQELDETGVVPVDRLRAFELPGQEPATSGWITSSGSQSRAGRPR